MPPWISPPPRGAPKRSVTFVQEARGIWNFPPLREPAGAVSSEAAATAPSLPKGSPLAVGEGELPVVVFTSVPGRAEVDAGELSGVAARVCSWGRRAMVMVAARRTVAPNRSKRAGRETGRGRRAASVRSFRG